MWVTWFFFQVNIKGTVISLAIAAIYGSPPAQNGIINQICKVCVGDSEFGSGPD